MDIYIKPAEKVQLVGKREVLLRDVAEVFLSGQTAGEAERLVVFRIPEERKKTYLLSTTIYLWLISLTASKELSILLLKLLECR